MDSFFLLPLQRTVTGTCCCGWMWSSTGSKIFSILLTLFGAWCFIYACLPETELRLILTAPAFIATGCLSFLAVHKNNAKWMRPVIFVSGVFTVIFFFFFAIASYSMFSDGGLNPTFRDYYRQYAPDPNDEQRQEQVLSSIRRFYLFTTLIAFVFSFWGFLVHYDAYRTILETCCCRDDKNVGSEMANLSEEQKEEVILFNREMEFITNAAECD